MYFRLQTVCSFCMLSPVAFQFSLLKQKTERRNQQLCFLSPTSQSFNEQAFWTCPNAVALPGGYEALGQPGSPSLSPSPSPSPSPSRPCSLAGCCGTGPGRGGHSPCRPTATLCSWLPPTGQLALAAPWHGSGKCVNCLVLLGRVRGASGQLKD